MPAVLVVEDDADVRDAIAEVLADAGYVVRTASHGGEALESMRAFRPCVVVLDLLMPIVDGWAVVREMLADPALVDIPVCVVTALEMLAPRTAACVLPKPLRLQTLLDAVSLSCGG